MIKALNLYCGIGGNRKLWKDVDVTAVEIDSAIAKIYQDFFPDDNVIVGDAHQYLLDHYREFNFIWSSPPCKSHSKARFLASSNGDYKPIYLDLSLYQEILFLRSYVMYPWVVENVRPYYGFFFDPVKISKNCFWSNFPISDLKGLSNHYHFNTVKELEKEKGFCLDGYDINKGLALRNAVNPLLGLHVFNCGTKLKQKSFS